MAAVSISMSMFMVRHLYNNVFLEKLSNQFLPSIVLLFLINEGQNFEVVLL